jgi:hypothetical protein
LTDNYWRPSNVPVSRRGMSIGLALSNLPNSARNYGCPVAFTGSKVQTKEDG